MKTKTNALTLTALLAISAIAPVALAADASPHPVTPGVGHGPSIGFVNGTHLLDGRYSFRANGNLNNEPSPYSPSGPVGRVGSIVFDGSGHVSAVFFFETVDGETFKVGGTGGLDDGWVFEDGSYQVNNNSLGHVQLRFTNTYYLGVAKVVSERIERWDIALTGGGKGFYLSNRSDLDTHPGTDPVWGTVTGEAHVD